MEREYSTVGEPGSPAESDTKSWAKLLYIIQNVILNDVAKNPVKASSSQTHFVCVVCSWEFSCAHHGEVDIKRQCDSTKSDTLAGSGFNVEDLVVDLDFYITGLTMVQNVKTN